MKNFVNIREIVHYKMKGGLEGNMEIKISLSSSDLERIKNVLGITDYDDIHTALVEAFDYMLEKEEKEQISFIK